MQYNWSNISNKIYGILKGSCDELTMYDAKGNETVDTDEATRFFAKFISNDPKLEDYTILVAIHDEGGDSHIDIKTPELTDDEDFEQINRIRTGIRKSIGSREGIKINWQVFDHAIDPREEAVNNVKESKQPVTELSRNTLKKYVKQASADMNDNAFFAGSAFSDKDKRSLEYDKKAQKRLKGIKKASDKLQENDSAPEDIMKQYKAKGVPGLYHYNHYEMVPSDGTFVQIWQGKPVHYVYQSKDGKQTEYRSFDELRAAVSQDHSTNEDDMVNESKDMSKVYGSTKSSYQNIGNARLIVRHSASVNEEKHGARSRNIKALLIENSKGERFAYPHLHVAGARAFARHISNGGTNHDQIAEKLFTISEHYLSLRSAGAKMRALTEGVDATWVPAIRESMQRINKQLKSMHGPKGYQAALTSLLQETLIEDESAINDLYGNISKACESIMNEKLAGDLKIAAKYIAERQMDPKPLNFAWNSKPDLTSKLNEFEKVSDRLKWQLNELASACSDQATMSRLASIAEMISNGTMPTESDLGIIRQAFESHNAYVHEEQMLPEQQELDEFLDDFTIESTFNEGELEEGLRLLKTLTDPHGSDRLVKVYKDSDTGEFIARHFVNGVHQKDADYFGTSLADAEGTGKLFINQERPLEINEDAECARYLRQAHWNFTHGMDREDVIATAEKDMHAAKVSPDTIQKVLQDIQTTVNEDGTDMPNDGFGPYYHAQRLYQEECGRKDASLGELSDEEQEKYIERVLKNSKNNEATLEASNDQDIQADINDEEDTAMANLQTNGTPFSEDQFDSENDEFVSEIARLAGIEPDVNAADDKWDKEDYFVNDKAGNDFDKPDTTKDLDVSQWEFMDEAELARVRKLAGIQNEGGFPDSNEDHSEEMDDDYDPDEEDYVDYGDDDRDDYDDRSHFADPGGRSALRAATADNPRNRSCPTCGHPNRLTPEDVARGYQCDKCADAAETGREIDYYDGPDLGHDDEEERHEHNPARIDFGKLDMYEGKPGDKLDIHTWQHPNGKTASITSLTGENVVRSHQDGVETTHPNLDQAQKHMARQGYKNVSNKTYDYDTKSWVYEGEKKKEDYDNPAPRKCKSCGKKFTPSYGEYHRCQSCLADQTTAGEHATGVQEALEIEIPEKEGLININGHKIALTNAFPPVPMRDYDWSAVLDDEYDGAPDAGHQLVGTGKTAKDAVNDLLDRIKERDEEKDTSQNLHESVIVRLTKLAGL